MDIAVNKWRGFQKEHIYMPSLYMLQAILITLVNRVKRVKRGRKAKRGKKARMVKMARMVKTAKMVRMAKDRDKPGSWDLVEKRCWSCPKVRVEVEISPDKCLVAVGSLVKAVRGRGKVMTPAVVEKEMGRARVMMAI